MAMNEVQPVSPFQSTLWSKEDDERLWSQREVAIDVLDQYVSIQGWRPGSGALKARLNHLMDPTHFAHKRLHAPISLASPQISSLARGKQYAHEPACKKIVWPPTCGSSLSAQVPAPSQTSDRVREKLPLQLEEPTVKPIKTFSSQPRPPPPSGDPLHAPSADPSALSVLPYGKHRGETFASIARADPSYCAWVLQQPSHQGVFREFQDYLIRKLAQ